MAKKIKVKEKIEIKHNKTNSSNIVVWIFGVLFLISGFVNLFTEPIAGFFMLLVGIFLLPPIKKIIEEKSGYKFSFWKSIGIVFGLIILSGFINGLIGIGVDENNNLNIIQDTNSQNDYVQTKKVEKIKTPIVERKKINSQNVETSTQDIRTQTPTPAIEKKLDKVTLGEKNALNKAQSYLSFSAFSRNGLIKQLEFDKFTKKQAEYGVNNSGADWDKQAVLKAQSYLSFSAFSRDGLIKQLEFDGFTKKQAEYGVQAVGY